MILPPNYQFNKRQQEAHMKQLLRRMFFWDKSPQGAHFGLTLFFLVPWIGLTLIVFLFYPLFCISQCNVILPLRLVYWICLADRCIYRLPVDPPPLRQQAWAFQKDSMGHADPRRRIVHGRYLFMQVVDNQINN